MKVKVSFFGLSDMLKFKNLKKNRLEAINNSKVKEYKSYRVNELADYYHPHKQYLKIDKIVEENNDTKSFYLVPDGETTKLAYFKSGSYVSLFVNVDNNIVSRAYAISSSPSEALKGIYRITIKRKEGGYLSNHLLDNAKVGDKLFASEPGGFLTHSSIRDANDVIAVVGGVGITPFISMANAIKDGIEHFNLTILYGVNSLKDVILKDELDELTKTCDKVKVVYVVCNETVEGCEKGFITADIIKKYAPTDKPYSVYVSGPNAMFDFLSGEFKKLNLPNKYIRLEKSPETLSLGNKEFNLIVHMEDQTFNLIAKQNETVLNALERNDVLIRSKCHLGGCGFCRSKIIKGEIQTTKLNKQADIDKKFGYFHPCCSYPMSDLEIEVYKY